ncbi:hypothetical protein LSG31_11585 [Fodinisporobacter ferrooxydans]|uniref:Uncharacterized protein n=1 Tax=Fodinisporobacter ferrooxydans TaxID=2901836 RepID=A0ABY4CDZ3_9BACL|nr:hypothetical protein LSG31_11585 [Alicyclobacillaceae bacterium MYW30-H2]
MVHAHKIRMKGAHVQIVLTDEIRARLLELLHGTTDCIVLDEVMIRSIRIHKVYSSGVKYAEAKYDHIKVDSIRVDHVPPYHIPLR